MNNIIDHDKTIIEDTDQNIVIPTKNQSDAVRIQDIIAKCAGVNLRDTVRVLRMLPMILDVIGENQIADGIDNTLRRGAVSGGLPAPLHSKPDALAIVGCEDIFESVVKCYGPELLQELRDLSDDPYFHDNYAELSRRI